MNVSMVDITVEKKATKVYEFTVSPFFKYGRFGERYEPGSIFVKTQKGASDAWLTVIKHVKHSGGVWLDTLKAPPTAHETGVKSLPKWKQNAMVKHFDLSDTPLTVLKTDEYHDDDDGAAEMFIPTYNIDGIRLERTTTTPNN